MTLEELRQALQKAAAPEGVEWVREAEAAVAADPTAVRLPVPRRRAGGRPRDAGPRGRAGDVHAWTVDDAARALLLAALGRPPSADLADLYRHGDAAERRGVLRALSVLALGDAAAGSGRGRRPHERHPADRGRARAVRAEPSTTPRWTHAVAEVRVQRRAVAALPGLPERATPGLARILAAYAHERIAAGRDVPAEVWHADRSPSARAGDSTRSRAESRQPGPSAAARPPRRSRARGRRSRMRIFEPHIHMTSRTTDDYEAMAAAGVSAIVEPAFWLGPAAHARSGRSSTTSTRCWAGSASAPASSASATTARSALNPKEANDAALAPRGARGAAALPGQGRRRRASARSASTP